MRYKVQPTIQTPCTTTYPQLFRWIFHVVNSMKIQFASNFHISLLKFHGRFRNEAATKPQSVSGPIVLKNSGAVFRQQISVLDAVLSATMIRTIGLL